MKISLPELLWYGNSTLEIELPDDWEIELCPMRGARAPALDLAALAALAAHASASWRRASSVRSSSSTT